MVQKSVTRVDTYRALYTVGNVFRHMMAICAREQMESHRKDISVQPHSFKQKQRSH